MVKQRLAKKNRGLVNLKHVGSNPPGKNLGTQVHHVKIGEAHYERNLRGCQGPKPPHDKIYEEHLTHGTALCRTNRKLESNSIHGCFGCKVDLSLY